MLFLDVRVEVALWLAYAGVIQILSTTTLHVALKILPRKLKTAWSCHSKDQKYLNEGLLYSLTRKKNNL